MGRSDLNSSVIGQGTGQFGTPAWGYGINYFESTVKEIVDKNLELGVNLFDTSETYGNGLSEILLGKYLSEYNREDYIIISKVAPWNLRYVDIFKAVKNSLNRLGMKYIDLYLVHYPNPFILLKESMRALEDLVKMGYIRYIGVSNFNNNQLAEANKHLKRNEIITNEIQYNILESRIKDDIYYYCKKNNISICSYSPLAGGILTNNYQYDELPSRVKAFNFYNRLNYLEKNSLLFNTLSQIAKKKNVSISQLALAYIINDSICYAIPASLNVIEVKDNVESINLQLSQHEIKSIQNSCIKLSDIYFFIDHQIVRPISWLKESIRHAF